MNVKTLFYAVAFLSLSWASFTYAQDVLPEYTQARRFAPSNAEQLLFSYTLTPNYFNNSDNSGTSIRRVRGQTGIWWTPIREINDYYSIGMSWRHR